MGDVVTARIGVEEEFHLVDLQTRRTAPAIDDMLAQLNGEEFAPELQRSLVEANALPCDSLDELRAELYRLRSRLNEVADPLGLGVVAAGTVPLVDPVGTNISAGARYERMQVWQRWPTAGPPGPMRTAADYDAMVADLVASGTISDPGMVYFDIRPSAHLSTVELRICDAWAASWRWSPTATAGRRSG